MQDETTPQWMLEQGYSPTFAKRFWSKVIKSGPSDCWGWTDWKDRNGYGQIAKRTWGMVKAHRASWMLKNGPIPDGLSILHKCKGGGNPWCVNPDHLHPGTQAQNVADMISNGRVSLANRARGERNGYAKLTTDQVIKIRKLCAESRISLKKMGKMFGVSDYAISRVKQRITWKHIP